MNSNRRMRARTRQSHRFHIPFRRLSHLLTSVSDALAGLPGASHIYEERRPVMSVEKDRADKRPLRPALPHPPLPRRPLPYRFTDWAVI